MGLSRARGTLKTDGATLVLANGGTGQTTLSTASTATRVWSFPDATDTVVGNATAATLTNKTFVAPALGAATATSVNGLTISTTTGTLTLTNGKTLAVTNTLTLGGVDGSTVAFGAGGTVAYTANKLSAFAATSSAELASVVSDETGSGALVFGSSPSLTTPTIVGGDLTALTTLSLDDTTSAFTLVLRSSSSGPLTSNRSLTFDVVDGSRTVSLGGSVLLAGSLTTTGGALSFALSGSTTLILPTSGTVATLDGSTFTNTTLTSPVLTSPTVRSSLLLQNTSGSQPTLAFSEDPDNGTDTVTIQAPASLSASYTLTLPPDDGTSGQVLRTDGAGVLTWVGVAATTGTDGWTYESSGTFASLAFATNGNKVAGVNSGGTSAEYKSFAVGTAGTDFAVAHGAGTITLNLPDANDTTARGVVSTGTQTFGGVKTFSSTLNIASGTVSVPSLAFSADADGSGTGIYRVGANSLGFAANGTNVGQYSAAGIWTIGTSTASRAGPIIYGVTDGSTFTAGAIGEEIRSQTSSFVSASGSNQYFDVVSISLTAGDWDLSGVFDLNANGATFTNTDFACGISATSGNNSTGLVVGDNLLDADDIAPTTWSNWTFTLPSYRVSISSTTTYYLKVLMASYSAGTPRARGRLSARRKR